MANYKRLCNRDIWKEERWFRILEPNLKLVWFYLKDRCDWAGVWPIRILDLLDKPGDIIDRYGEADILAVAGDGRIDAHHLPVHIHQRSAGVTLVNGRIGLKQVVQVFGGAGIAR